MGTVAPAAVLSSFAAIDTMGLCAVIRENSGGLAETSSDSPHHFLEQEADISRLFIVLTVICGE
jgi:hypothetical protein